MSRQVSASWAGAPLGPRRPEDPDSIPAAHRLSPRRIVSPDIFSRRSSGRSPVGRADLGQGRKPAGSHLGPRGRGVTGCLFSRPFVSQLRCLAGKRGSWGTAGGPAAAALAPPPSGFPEAAGGSGWRTLEKVWATVSGRPGHAGHRKQGLPFSECCSRLPGIVSPTLST